MGAGGMAAGAMLGMVGSVLGAKSTLDQGAESLRTAKINAERMRATAASVEDVARQDAARVRSEATQVIGEQRAAFGASGIDASVGSAANLAVASRQQAELDALRLKNNAAREAWGIRTQAAEVARQGRAAKEASKMATIGQIMGGVAGSGSSAYSAYKNRG